MNRTAMMFFQPKSIKKQQLDVLACRTAGKEVTVVFYFSTITGSFAVTVVATTAKARRPRQVGLCCNGPSTAASCAGLT